MATVIETDSSSPVLQLNWAARDENIVVTPSDQDRYVLKVGRAVELLGLASRADRFQQQLTLLLKVLAGWIQEVDSIKIKRAFLTLRDGALLFVVIRDKAGCDDDFDDSLSDVDFDIANDSDLDLIEMNAIALPPVPSSSLESFLDPAFILEYAGHAN